MAHLGQFKIEDTNEKYIKLSELIGIDFDDNSLYLMQTDGSYISFIESENEPTEGGFIIKSTERFYYEADITTPLWVNTNGCVLNISN